MLDPHSSCRRALSRVQSLCAAKGLAAVSGDTTAYCRSRARLPARLLLAVLGHITQAVARAAADFGGTGRLLVMDGTTVTMPRQPRQPRHVLLRPGAEARLRLRPEMLDDKNAQLHRL